MENKITSDVIYYENIFHDIKLPVTIVHTTLQLLNSMDLPQGVKDHLKTAQNGCFHIMKLLADAGDLAKVERGHLSPVLVSCDVVPLIKNIVENTSLLAYKKDIAITFENNISQKIMATDKSMLERILLNLLSNSIKFTQEKGKIDVIFTDKGDTVVITVLDNGPGIMESEIKNIFNRYVTSNQVEGTGLGLGIVKELVQALGGDLSVKNQNGCCFMVTLPVNTTTTEEKTLYVDDFYKDNIVQIELAEHRF